MVVVGRSQAARSRSQPATSLASSARMAPARPPAPPSRRPDRAERGVDRGAGRGGCRNAGAARARRLRRAGNPAVPVPVRCRPSALGRRAQPWLGRSARAVSDRVSWSRRPAARGPLSGGQRAQLALTLAVAKRPELLVLDEPVASLDPLARREFLQGLMEFTAEHTVASCSRRISSPISSVSATT